jgi:rRNA processing protein Gar1
MPRGGKKVNLPVEILVSVAGPPDKPYYTIHRADLSNVVQDNLVVGVYRLKKTRVVRLTRTLERPPKE